MDGTHQAMRAAPRGRLLLALTAAHLLIDLSQGAVPALGPFLRQARGLSYSQVGALALAVSLAGSLLQPLLGIYSDRTRTGRLVVAGLLCAGAGLAGLGLATAFPGLLLSAALIGTAVAAFHPEATRAAYDLGREARATAMSVFQVGGNAGYGLGPALAGSLLMALGPHGLLVLAMPVLAWAAAVGVLLPELRRAGAFGAPPRPGGAGPGGGTGSRAFPGTGPQASHGVARDRWGELAKVLAVVMLRSLFQLTLVAFAPLYYVDVRGGDPRWAGPLVSLYLLSGAVGTLVGGPLADRIGLRRYLAGCMALLLPLHLLTLTLPGGWAALALALQGFALVSTYAVAAVLSQVYLPSRPALAAGLNVGLGMAAGGVGTGLAGVLADALGLVPVMYGLLAMPAAAAAVALTLEESEGEPGTPAPRGAGAPRPVGGAPEATPATPAGRLHAGGGPRRGS